MDWYPWFVDDFRRDTLHLSLAEDGAYRRLIDEYMRIRGPLPGDDASLARVLGVGLDEWLAVAPKVRRYFRFQQGRLMHKRCEQELRAQELRSKVKSESGKKAALTRWGKINRLDARTMRVPATLTLRKNLTSSECGIDAKKEASEREEVSPSIGFATPELAATVRKWVSR